MTRHRRHHHALPPRRGKCREPTTATVAIALHPATFPTGHCAASRSPAAAKSSAHTLWRSQRFGTVFSFEHNINNVTRRELQVFIGREPF